MFSFLQKKKFNLSNKLQQLFSREEMTFLVLRNDEYTRHSRLRG